MAEAARGGDRSFPVKDKGLASAGRGLFNRCEVCRAILRHRGGDPRCAIVPCC